MFNKYFYKINSLFRLSFFIFMLLFFIVLSMFSCDFLNQDINSDDIDAFIDDNIQKPQDILESDDIEGIDMSFIDEEAFVLENQGYVLSDMPYDSSAHKLAFTDLSTFFDRQSLPQSYLCAVNQLPYLHPRMGFLFRYDSDGNSMIFSSDGEIVTDISSPFLFVGVRDRQGQPLFVKDNEYYFADENNLFQIAQYNPNTDSVGYIFDYPSYFINESDDFENPYPNLIYRNNRYGYADSNGKTIVSPVYKSGYAFSEGLGCLVDSMGRLFFFDERGKIVIGRSYVFYDKNEEIASEMLGYYYFKGGLVRALDAPISNNSHKEVLIKKNGTVLSIPSDYQIISYSDRRILLEKDGRYGFMNESGKWITKPIYKNAYPFCEGLAPVCDSNDKWGMIDLDGTVVIPFIFDGISDCSGGLISLFQKENGWFLIKKLLLT